jgi:hypothetical protein
MRGAARPAARLGADARERARLRRPAAGGAAARGSRAAPGGLACREARRRRAQEQGADGGLAARTERTGRAEARGSERVRAAGEGTLVACGCDGSADAGPEARVAQENGGRPGARASAERAGRALRRSKPT